jgi:hypothetical protein
VPHGPQTGVIVTLIRDRMRRCGATVQDSGLAGPVRAVDALPSLTIIGEYVGWMYREVKQRSLCHVNEIITNQHHA